MEWFEPIARTSSSRFSRNRGMALIEYGIIGVSVVVGCIAAFLVMGNQLNDWILVLRDDSKEQIHNTEIQNAAITQARNAFEEEQARAAVAHLANVETEALRAAGGGSLCGDNWCIEAPGLTGTTVSTAGSNGNQMVQLTNSAAGIYGQLAKILETQGADASLVSLLTNLANQGHALGTAQSQFRNGGSYENMKTGVQNFQSGITNFKHLNQQLISSLNQLPPDTRGILQDASKVIISIGDSYTLNLGSGSNSTVGYQFQSTNIKLTHSNSNTICSNGGDTSQCVK